MKKQALFLALALTPSFISANSGHKTLSFLSSQPLPLSEERNKRAKELVFTEYNPHKELEEAKKLRLSLARQAKRLILNRKCVKKSSRMRKHLTLLNTLHPSNSISRAVRTIVEQRFKVIAFYQLQNKLQISALEELLK